MISGLHPHPKGMKEPAPGSARRFPASYNSGLLVPWRIVARDYALRAFSRGIGLQETIKIIVTIGRVLLAALIGIVGAYERAR